MRVICVCVAAISLVWAYPASLVPRLDRRAGALENAIYDVTNEAFALDPNVSAALGTDPAVAPLGVAPMAAVPGYPPIQGYPMMPGYGVPQPLPYPVAPAGYGGYPVQAQFPSMPMPPSLPPAMPNTPYPATPQPDVQMPESSVDQTLYAAPPIEEIAQPETPPPAQQPVESAPLPPPPAPPVAPPPPPPSPPPPPPLAPPSVPPQTYVTPAHSAPPNSHQPSRYHGPHRPPPAAPVPVADYQTETEVHAESPKADKSEGGSFNPIGNLVKGISNGLGDLLSGLGGAIRNDSTLDDNTSPVAQPNSGY
ncbi:hypothetical protein GGI09_005452 [Coemansia sp. S100]|nr:hypothetical protein GGI09_005452 [Coemansia sp. S100]